MNTSDLALPIGDEVEEACRLAARIAAAEPQAWDLARAVELCRLHLSPPIEKDRARWLKRLKVVVAWSDARLSDISLAIAHAGAYIVGLPKSPRDIGSEVFEHIFESALAALRSGKIDVLVLVDARPGWLLRSVEDCRYLLRSHSQPDHQQAFLIGNDLQKVDRLNGLLATSVPPMRAGLSLEAYRVIDLAENALTDRTRTPYVRTLKKLRSTGVSVEKDRNAFLRAAAEFDGRASEKVLGVMPAVEFLEQKHQLGDLDFVIVPCNDPDESDVPMAILATGQSADLMSAAGAFEGVIATPEPEWQRWLI